MEVLEVVVVVVVVVGGGGGSGKRRARLFNRRLENVLGVVAHLQLHFIETRVWWCYDAGFFSYPTWLLLEDELELLRAQSTENGT